jgi:hypothetical protein
MTFILPVLTEFIITHYISVNISSTESFPNRKTNVEKIHLVYAPKEK